MDDPLLPASGQNCSNNERQLVDCSMIKILHWKLVDSQEHPGTCGLLVTIDLFEKWLPFNYSFTCI